LERLFAYLRSLLGLLHLNFPPAILSLPSRRALSTRWAIIYIIIIIIVGTILIYFILTYTPTTTTTITHT